MTRPLPVACSVRAAGSVAVPTSWWRRWIACLVLLAAMLGAVLPALAWEPGSDALAVVPTLAARVNDHTRTLTAAEVQALEAKLAGWETKTGNQLVVLLVPTTQPEPIEAYSIRVAEAWKIGRRGQDNGVLLVVAKNDKKLRIEVGYGLEGVLPDVVARRIIAETIAPAFRDGRFGAGIDAGVDAIIRTVGSGGAPAPAPKASAAKRSGFDFDLESLLVVVLVVVPIVGAVLRRIFGRFLGSLVGAGVMGTAAFVVVGSLVIAIVAGVIAFVVMLVMGFGSGFSGRRGGGVFIPGGGWGGGGGWSGGSGGGFSGGGGGSFGGGGASGDWN